MTRRILTTLVLVLSVGAAVAACTSPASTASPSLTPIVSPSTMDSAAPSMSPASSASPMDSAAPSAS